MFLRRITEFIMQSRLHAIGAAFVVAFIPMLGTVSILIAALVTLRKGAFEGVCVLFAATLPYVISYVIGSDRSDIAMAAVIIMVASNAMTWFFSLVLRRYGDWSVALEWAGLLGIVCVLLTHLFYPDIVSWWVNTLHLYFDQTTHISPVSADAEQQMISAVKHYATGTAFSAILFNALLQLLLARWWQAILYNPNGLRQEVRNVRLSYVSGGIFILGLGLSYWGNALVLDIMPVIYFIFCMAGLSTLHWAAGLTRFAWLCLLIVYAGIIWFFPLSITIISVIALLDTGIDFRKRFFTVRK